MRHIIAINLQNEAGALTRVAGLFSTRGYNIESLSVAATDDPTVSRITLVTKGSDSVMQQIISQLNKLIDVVAVEDMTQGKDINVKALVGPATGLLAGVTESITYALIMRFRRTILIVAFAVQLVLH